LIPRIDGSIAEMGLALEGLGMLDELGLR